MEDVPYFNEFREKSRKQCISAFKRILEGLPDDQMDLVLGPLLQFGQLKLELDKFHGTPFVPYKLEEMPRVLKIRDNIQNYHWKRTEQKLMDLLQRAVVFTSIMDNFLMAEMVCQTQESEDASDTPPPPPKDN